MKMPAKLATFGKKVLVKLDKHSPEILMVSGVACIVGGTILACKATLHVEEIMEERENSLSDIERALEDTDGNYNYTDEMFHQDIRTLKVRTAAKLVKNYVPSVGLITLGVGCFLGSYGILKKRNVALTAAYNALTTAFSNYRTRVIEELGEEKDKEFYYGKKEKKQVVDPETGEIVEKDILNTDGYTSPYHKFFDESSQYFVRNATQNLFFLTNQQNWANDKLKQQGCLFLNEVYDMLGLPRTQIGAIVGWIYGKDGKDNYVDFGFRDITREKTRDFVNGYEDVVLLDFNVDGVIYDKI